MDIGPPGCGSSTAIDVDVTHIVAFRTAVTPVHRILTRIGKSAAPPQVAPARSPPGWDGGLRIWGRFYCVFRFRAHAGSA